MTTIKASCPCCGDLELTPKQVRLVVCSAKERSFYSFHCPKCKDVVRKPAGEDVIALLVSGGVAVERWSIPAEAMEEHVGSGIVWDDVLDFALVIDRCDNLAALAADGLRTVR